ncbi:store-operated calcium entry-associated regulatory factor [Alosa sapidissima]|uniref:store-operated calcium entry-associated regulatory factor n=1 Tax=Alosa sapidissima TaxID=34773 RepID=UPI001C08E8F7|nr:store-operated calcium entry-associated regulatory factor [Alosa sapidissima]
MATVKIIVLSLLVLFLPHIRCWNEGAVLLRDVQVLTLYKGRYTTARRSSPVPQLQCVGGSAGCASFIPEVVQCQNKGWDGIDAQWECKADMDNTYRFGRIEVSCEGFNQPDDPYILSGSCGLEYTLELTEEGRSRHSHQGWGGGGGGGGGGVGGGGGWGSSGFSQFASSFFSGNKHHGGQQQRASSGYGQHPSGDGEGAGGLVVIALLLLLAYGVYKMFLCGPTHGQGQGQERFPSDGDWQNGQGGHSGPPPPGFKPDYMGADHSSGYPGSGPSYGFADQFTRPHSSSRHNTGGGFWTGMGTGGILGYLFGNRRQPTTGHSWGSNTTQNTPRTPPASSGTRTASGFGGTKRR